MKFNEVIEKFQFVKFKDKFWFVQFVIVIDGEGLIEGFGWLLDNIKKMFKYGGK